MTLDPDYPRMMFHPTKDWVIVKSAEEETALGSEWSRTIVPKGSEPEPAKPAVAPRTKLGRFAKQLR
jgi:hypothetical protein